MSLPKVDVNARDDVGHLGGNSSTVRIHTADVCGSCWKSGKHASSSPSRRRCEQGQRVPRNGDSHDEVYTVRIMTSHAANTAILSMLIDKVKDVNKQVCYDNSMQHIERVWSYGVDEGGISWLLGQHATPPQPRCSCGHGGRRGKHGRSLRCLRQSEGSLSAAEGTRWVFGNSFILGYDEETRNKENKTALDYVHSPVCNKHDVLIK